jgi:hypothetical protein
LNHWLEIAASEGFAEMSKISDDKKRAAMITEEELSFTYHTYFPDGSYSYQLTFTPIISIG